MVVDDHPMWRDAVARDLAEAGFEVAATVADGAQALRVVGAVRPDVVVLDLQLPDMSGVEVSRTELLDAVRRTAGGDAVFTPGLAALVLGEFRRLAAAPAGKGTGAPQLTERETQILRMVATGQSYKQIATRLTLSHRTVQNHVQNTLGKLHLHNRTELVRYAIEHGLDGEPE
jgi:DNA-binding NarL/FixJ family response regulator